MGSFNISSTYNLTMQQPQPTNRIWQHIWKLKIPRRIRVFIWLLMHGKVLSNMDRVKRGLTSNSYCHYFTEEREDLNHIFRFCTKAKNSWERSAKDDFGKSHHILPFTDWLCWNFNIRNQENRGPWKERFALSLWWIWK